MPLRRGAGALALCLAVGVVLSSGALSTGITFEDPNCAALDASCSSERISFDGEKLLVPGYCETGTCSSLNSDVLSLKTRVSSIESTISQVQAELSSLGVQHAQDVASLRNTDASLLQQGNSTSIDLHALAAKVAAINRNLTSSIQAARIHHDNEVAELHQHFEDLKAAGQQTDISVTVLEAATHRADRQLNASIAAARKEHATAISDLNARYEGLRSVDTEDQLKLSELNRTTRAADNQLRVAIDEARQQHAAVVAAVKANHSALSMTQAETSAKVSALQSALTSADARLTAALSAAEIQHDADINALSAVDSLLQIADTNIRTEISALAQSTADADAKLQSSIDDAEVQHRADVKALHEKELPMAPTYELRSVGECGVEKIASARECEMAAKDLGLMLGAAELLSSGPAGCYSEAGTLYYSANPDTNAQCSASQQCVCHATPSTVSHMNTLTPATPAHSAVVPAATYFQATEGICATPISTRAECEHAAQELGLRSTVAQPDGMAWSYDPTGCYYEDGVLKFNEHGNTGSCTISDACICKA